MKKKTIRNIIIAFCIVVLIALVGIWHTIYKIREALHDARIVNVQGELKAVDDAMAGYHTEYGVYPSGSAADIFDLLEGANPKAIRFLEWSDREDAWRQRYLLKLGSASSRPAFYSSGPNKMDDKCSAGSDDIEFVSP